MNDELLSKTFDWIVDNPHHHDQKSWGHADDSLLEGVERKLVRPVTGGFSYEAVAVEVTCGTSMCFAGAAVHLENPGAMLLVYMDDADRGVATEMELPDGEVVDIANEAQHILGLSITKREELFDGENSIERIHRLLVTWGVLPKETFIEYQLRRSLEKVSG